jgi:hypothetical protein
MRLLKRDVYSTPPFSTTNPAFLVEIQKQFVYICEV